MILPGLSNRRTIGPSIFDILASDSAILKGVLLVIALSLPVLVPPLVPALAGGNSEQEQKESSRDRTPSKERVNAKWPMTAKFFDESCQQAKSSMSRQPAALRHGLTIQPVRNLNLGETLERAPRHCYFEVAHDWSAG